MEVSGRESFLYGRKGSKDRQCALKDTSLGSCSFCWLKWLVAVYTEEYSSVEIFCSTTCALIDPTYYLLYVAILNKF